MKVSSLTIENFRNIKQAKLHFEGHTLLVGKNNVGKSTVCEALDLVLGPDRVTKFPPVEEFDFYNAKYLSEDGTKPVPARIEVILTELSDVAKRACATHLEFWHSKERRLLESGEVDKCDQSDVLPCLRLETIASYSIEDDEFEAETYFSSPPPDPDKDPERVGKKTKRLFGFLYLRALRTGARALSLERGSLLDIILRKQEVRTELWENAIKRLRDLKPPISEEAPEIAPVLESIERRLAQYIPLQPKGKATSLFVTQLTREHLRKTISFFLSLTPDQEPVPFQEAGTGTLNTLVLALLSFIAEVKKENVIFAMEEPEIALPPHTQRRVANYLLSATTQCFVTSHSPYVIERFSPSQIQILRRDDNATLTATPISVGSTLEEKTYRRHARRGLAEAMLGSGVIVAEGFTEQTSLRAAADLLESMDEIRYPLDLSGVSIFSVDGDGALSKFGSFFRSLGLRAYAFYDKKTRKPDEQKRITDSFDLANETTYLGMEDLLVAEVPVGRQWDFLQELKAGAEQGDLGIPAVRPKDDQLRQLMRSALRSNKGTGYSARLLQKCDVTELPHTITEFLDKVYGDFPRPEPPQDTDASPEKSAAEDEGLDLLG